MMKPKKNPKIDLNKDRAMYFVAGLTLILLLTYIALEWKSYDKIDYGLEAMNIEDELMEEVPLTIHFTPPPPPTAVTPDIIEIVKNDKPIEDIIIESTESNEYKEIIEVKDVPYEEIEEDIPIPISVVEVVPIFPGCEQEKDKRACFNRMILKHVRKTFRYPEISQEMGVQGKVYMNFVIQKDGSIGEVKIARSPDKNLGMEATRIIDKLPKMTPGKQAGRAVRVPFSIPITFKLQ
ncbi:energy transducer TonB [Ulvibacterium sp.]|uniref:energy transducer TonB n=1 Tax=Ulvibacterium sp. TaxID=2665914 RepID=UPI003CC5F70D